MTGWQPLTTERLIVRLTVDFAVVGFCLWALLTDLGRHNVGWAVFDGMVLALCAWLTFTDAHNWKDRSPRFTLVRRQRP